MTRGSALAFGLGLVIAVAILFTAESLSGWWNPDPGLAQIEGLEAAGRSFDPRTRMQVVRDLRAHGVQAVPRLPPASLREGGAETELRSAISIDGREVLPLAGISSRTTVLCNEGGDFAIFRSDARGFRNPSDPWQGARADVLVLGDSFAIGECVAPGETFADGLRSRRPGTVNLGYSGNSPLLALASLAEYGPALAPETTLWLFFENDLAPFDIGRDRRTPLLMRYLEPGFHQGLAELQPAIDRALEARVRLALESPGRVEAGPGSEGRLAPVLQLRALRAMLADLRRRAVPPESETTEPDYALLAAALRRARERTASWNGRLVFVYLPGVWKFRPGDWTPSWGRAEVREGVRARVASEGVRFIDVEAAMRGHPDPLSLYSFRGRSRLLGQPHLSAAGYAFAAATVVGELGW